MLVNRKDIKYCIFGYMITVLAALILLLGSTYLPQGEIEKHVQESLEVFDIEGHYGRSGDYEDSSQKDGFTDALILQASLVTHSGQTESILTNPMYGPSLDSIGALKNLVGNEEVNYSNPDWNYTRYWMGFRVPLRIMLTGIDYAQIRTYLGIGLFSLMALVACVVAKYTDLQAMFMFMLSIIFVKPQVICNSLQFSCCFFLAFIFMLGVPYIQKNRKWETLFFMEAGMLTMYFDFYTSPTIVFGYSMVFLCLIDVMKNKKIKAKAIVKDAIAWLIGYAMMWVAKLVLTTILTDCNALESGFGSLSGRLGIVKNEGLEEYYSVSLAFKNVIETILPNRVDKIFAIMLTICLLGYILILIIKKKIELKNIKSYSSILLVAAIPLIWFAVAAQPTAIHAFFQYRNIALTYWAVGAYLCMIQGKNSYV